MVFCAVTAVIAVEQYTPRAAQALISAWIPAPAPESEPATVSTCGIFIFLEWSLVIGALSSRISTKIRVCKLLLILEFVNGKLKPKDCWNPCGGTCNRFNAKQFQRKVSIQTQNESSINLRAQQISQLLRWQFVIDIQ